MALLIYSRMLNLEDNSWNSAVQPGKLVDSWDINTDVTTGPLRLTPQGFCVEQPGIYKIEGVATYRRQTGLRVAVACRIAVNGDPYDVIGRSGYARGSSGDDHGSSYCWASVRANRGDELGLYVFRDAGTGIAVADAGQSSLTIERKA